MKILVFAGFSKSLIHFRKELLERMIRNGHEVIAVGPEDNYKTEIENIGVKFIQLKFNRLAVNPLLDLKLIYQLSKLMKSEKPDVFFGYTIKPVIYGTIAARLSGVKRRYSMVTGIGSLFISSNKKTGILKSIAKKLYKLGFIFNEKVFFQNNDDIEEFVKMKLIPNEKCILVNGSGVNLDQYTASPLPNKNIFLFVGSVMGDKGIREYIEAANLVKLENSDAEFWIVGPMDNRISGISEKEMDDYVNSGLINYFGAVDNVKNYLDKCRYFVLPSYREGTPRSVLEAMAKGRPIITTDAPGCRETVINNVNGFLVPIKDYKVLSEKMLWMMKNPVKVEKMSKESLSLVKEKYEVQKINRQMLKVMGLE